MNLKFEEYLKSAICLLKNGRLKEVPDILLKAEGEDPHSPEVQNLYGILAELMLDEEHATRHYKAAYALDPTYLPATNNLMRLGTFEHRRRNMEIDFGEPNKIIDNTGE